MTFMKSDKTITHIKKSHNLFTYNFTIPGQIMPAISKAITITGWGQSIYFLSKNKRICFWHQQLAHISNAQVVKVFKLIESIDLGPTKGYNPIEIFVDSKNLDNSKKNSWKKPIFI